VLVRFQRGKMYFIQNRFCPVEIEEFMTSQEIEKIFRAQTDNVRELEKAWSHINRSINDNLRSDNDTAARFHTKMLGLVFCAYSEAMFSKLIHTPHGLSSSEIEQIKAKAKRDIVEAWLKCMELATLRINAPKSSHIPNISQTIKRLIQKYIKEPSLMRNKIAHGQWKVSLNRDNTDVNNDITQKVASLTVIDLQRYKNAFDKLSLIVEDIIESPNKAHWEFYWQHVDDYEQEQKKMLEWTLASKTAKLKKKTGYHQLATD
jgi:hypothetical protein